MRTRCLKHQYNNCVRLLSKRSLHLCCISILIFVLVNFFKLESNSCLLSHSSPWDNILDRCMLDNTPCDPDINQALDRYFNKIQSKYSMLLTYHPKIDCEHGRYLLLNSDLPSHVYHGTGSQLMWYLGVLNIAYVFNLTLIHLPWTAEHADDESNEDRDRYWKFYDWEIAYSAYETCSKNSSIKRNIFQYNLLANQTFDQHHNGKQPFTVKTNFKSLFEQFLNKLQNNQTGFTFYSSRTFTITSSLMEIGLVFETRWWLQHRKTYQPKYGVWSGLPIQTNYLSNDSIQCPLFHRDQTLLIGVHIRHGDVIKRNKQGQIIFGDLYRYISPTAYAPLLITIIQSLPANIRNKYLITIYSEGVVTDFADIVNELKETISDIDCHLRFFLNGRTSETFNRLLREDIMINAHSTFSMASGIFNSRQLKIGPAHNRGRVHGMRNHLSLELNRNHTLFFLTPRKQFLIKQRIKYVWQEKQKQLQTPKPLWLENYSKDYPEEFMLI